MVVVELLGAFDGLGDVVGRRRGRELGDPRRMEFVVSFSIVVVAVLLLLAIVFCIVGLLFSFEFFAFGSWKSFLSLGFCGRGGFVCRRGWHACGGGSCVIFLLDLRHQNLGGDIGFQSNHGSSRRSVAFVVVAAAADAAANARYRLRCAR